MTRPTTQPSAQASVSAYHRTLSDHLTNLLRNTGSTMPPPTCPSSTTLSKVSSASSSNQAAPSRGRPSSIASQGQTQLSTSAGSSLPGLAGKSVKSAETCNVVTPEENRDIHREREHRRAWDEVGSKVYHARPSEFQLCLESGESTPSGSNIILRRSRDLAPKMGLSLQTPPITTSPSKTGKVYSSTCRGKHILANYDFSRPPSPPVASPSTSTTPMGEQAPILDVKEIPPCTSQSQTREVEHDAEYEARKAYRLQRKSAQLKARVNRWRQSLEPHVEVGFPDIYPTPPTPSIAIRLSPFGSDVPKGHAPFDSSFRARTLDALIGSMSFMACTPPTHTEASERRFRIIRDGSTTPRCSRSHSPMHSPVPA